MLLLWHFLVNKINLSTEQGEEKFILYLYKIYTCILDICNASLFLLNKTM